MGRPRIHPSDHCYIHIALTEEEREWIRRRHVSPSVIIRELINAERKRDLKRIYDNGSYPRR